MISRILTLAFVAATLVACGSTSDLATLNDGMTAGEPAKPNFSAYNRVVVREFANKVDKNSDIVHIGTARFAEYIAQNLRSNSAFPEVVLSTSRDSVAMTPQTLVVDGDITRYVEGNAVLRALVGMGAGSAYFDATVFIRDGMTGKPLAQSQVDLNSWGLGGVLAADQTVNDFMLTSAAKIATDVVMAKNTAIKPASGKDMQISKE